MNRKKILLLSGIILLAASLYAGSFWRGKILPIEEVKKRWGDVSINDYKKFKESTVEEKAKYAYKIATDKSLIGKHISFIRDTFGSPDGFYFIDVYPAYIIQEGKSKKDETWQLVFLLDNKASVREIIIHKNCCE